MTVVIKKFSCCTDQLKTFSCTFLTLHEFFFMQKAGIETFKNY